MWIGYWKDIPPTEMIAAKRRLDKAVNIYRFLLSEDFYRAYNAYIYTIFRTHTGSGNDARIRALIEGPNGSRRNDTNYAWEQDFEALFQVEDAPSKKEVHAAYETMMNALRNCLGLESGHLNQPEPVTPDR